MKVARTSLGIDQDEMGERLGVSREWISKVENGRQELGELLQIKLTRIEKELSGESTGADHVTPVNAARESPSRYGVPIERDTRHPNADDAPGSASEPTEAEILAFVSATLARATRVPGGRGHMLHTLRKAFPPGEYDPPAKTR